MKQKIIDIALLCAAVGIGIFFFRLVSDNAGLAKALREQELQANALIFEIGKTKEENQTLFDRIKLLEQKFFGSVYGVSAPLPAQQKIARPSSAQMGEAQPDTLNILIIGHNKKLADTIMVAALSEENKTATLIRPPITH